MLSERMINETKDLTVNESIIAPVTFDILKQMNRIFIFGLPSKSVPLAYMMMGGFADKFSGYFTSQDKKVIIEERTSFRIHHIDNILETIRQGDFVFLYERNKNVEQQLMSRGACLGVGGLLVQIYTTYELPVFLKFCDTYIEGKGITLDIGANYGTTTAILAHYSEYVYAFETNKTLLAGMLHNLAFIDNYEIIHKAVYNRSGIVDIVDCEDGNMSMRSMKKDKPSIQIEAVTIDDFCLENDIVPTTLKIDVEGVDGEVILGARKLIEKFKPKIFCEHPLHGANQYTIDKMVAEEAMRFLETKYELLAYPHKNQLCDPQDIGAPHNYFCNKYDFIPVNFAAV